MVGWYSNIPVQVVFPDSISVSASPPSVPADGKTASTVTATVYDADHNPVPGASVAFATS
jgi:hypothetical protein